MARTDGAAAQRLSEELRTSPVLAQLLLNRGVSGAEDARKFLAAALSGLHDPAMLPGVPEAAERIHKAVRDGRRICIYGDYDVDGISGTTLLWRCLQLAGAQVEFYVPHRLEEGYGVNCDALRSIAKNGVSQVITVDCGITSCNECDEAKKLGLEMIVTDHHEFKPELPKADVVIHPRLAGSTYPFQGLCGAGVAFKLAWAISQQFSEGKKVTEAFRNFLVESVALVALGTVADVVPLVDENRIFVRHGLKSLKEGPSIGIKALLEATKLNEKPELDASHIGFTLAPRINAAGRLGQARLAVELLATSSPQRAADLARYLNEQNELRQKVERKIVSEAREMVEASGDLANHPALVLASPDWHPGVIGIVAGRLVDRYARPVLMISLRENPGQGSGRSVEGFPLHEALRACDQHLIAHGGHAAAAGLRVDATQVDALREKFCAYAAANMNGRPLQHTLQIDAEIPLSVLTMGLIRGLALLHPFGQGNRRPMFMAGGLQIVGQPKLVGGGERHVSFRVRQQNGPNYKCIAFGMAERLPELMSANGQCCLVFAPNINEWNGYTSIDLEVQDFQAGPVADLS